MLRERFKQSVEDLAKKLKSELEAQGHRATGRLADSIEAVNGGSEFLLVSEILMESYWNNVNYGVSASKIPYSGRNGRGGTSLYIQGLINWAKVIKPNLSEKEAKSFAFAVANKHKKEGMPTRGSYAYSNNGRRLRFVETALIGFEAQLEKDLDLDLFAGELITEISKFL